MTGKIDGVYFDSTDGQNYLLVSEGTYTIEHEHLTERGKVNKSESEIQFEIIEGDREGAPPYKIEIIDAENSLLDEDLVSYLGNAFVSAVLIQQDGKPFLNENGIFAKCNNDGTLDLD